MYAEMIAEAVVFGLSATRQLMDEKTGAVRANAYVYIDETTNSLKVVFTPPFGIGSVVSVDAPPTDEQFWQTASHYSAQFMREHASVTTPDRRS